MPFNEQLKLKILFFHDNLNGGSVAIKTSALMLVYDFENEVVLVKLDDIEFASIPSVEYQKAS